MALNAISRPVTSIAYLTQLIIHCRPSNVRPTVSMIFSWKVCRFKSAGYLLGQEPKLEDSMLPEDFTLMGWCKENSLSHKTEGIHTKAELDAEPISLLDYGEIRCWACHWGSTSFFKGPLWSNGHSCIPKVPWVGMQKMGVHNVNPEKNAL